jgi:DNA-binding NarL/FixJ family response regulator
MPTTILIADDHAMFAEGLAALLQKQGEISVVAYADNGEEAAIKTRELSPDIVIMDLNMPVLDGVGATRRISEESPRTRVIILTMNNEASFVARAVEAGAFGYMLKNSTHQELHAAIETVKSGRQYFSPGVAHILLQQELSRKKIAADESADNDEEMLTPREVAVAKLLVQDMTNADIADALHISIRTVEGHRMNILRKLNVKSVVGLTKYATKKGWL